MNYLEISKVLSNLEVSSSENFQERDFLLQFIDRKSENKGKKGNIIISKNCQIVIKVHFKNHFDNCIIYIVSNFFLGIGTTIASSVPCAVPA